MQNSKLFLKSKIKISSKKSKLLISDLIRKEFDKPKITQDRAEELLATAYVWNLDCLESMIEDYNFENFEQW